MKRILMTLLAAACMTMGLAAHARDDRLSAPQALEASRAGVLLLLDVRSPGEWVTTGVPKYASPVTIHRPGGSRAFYRAVLAAADGDKGQPIGLICASGVRSHRAMQILRAGGFEQVYNVAEGFEGSRFGPGWRRRGYPIERWTGG